MRGETHQSSWSARLCALWLGSRWKDWRWTFPVPEDISPYEDGDSPAGLAETQI